MINKFITEGMKREQKSFGFEIKLHFNCAIEYVIDLSKSYLFSSVDVTYAHWLYFFQLFTLYIVSHYIFLDEGTDSDIFTMGNFQSSLN